MEMVEPCHKYLGWASERVEPNQPNPQFYTIKSNEAMCGSAVFSYFADPLRVSLFVDARIIFLSGYMNNFELPLNVIIVCLLLLQNLQAAIFS